MLKGIDIIQVHMDLLKKKVHMDTITYTAYFSNVVIKAIKDRARLISCFHQQNQIPILPILFINLKHDNILTPRPSKNSWIGGLIQFILCNLNHSNIWFFLQFILHRQFCGSEHTKSYINVCVWFIFTLNHKTMNTYPIEINTNLEAIYYKRNQICFGSMLILYHAIYRIN